MSEGEWIDPPKPKLHKHPKPRLYDMPDTEAYHGRRWRCSCGMVFYVRTGSSQRDGDWRAWSEGE